MPGRHRPGFDDPDARGEAGRFYGIGNEALGMRCRMWLSRRPQRRRQPGRGLGMRHRWRSGGCARCCSVTWWGFTPLSEARDPEAVRELLSCYFEIARTVIDRYGGVVEKFIGDAAMAVWGAPVAAEGDAERAVRAGLDLLAAVAQMGAEAGAPGLAARCGVVTGEVAVTLGATHEGMVAGDAVNTAARAQAAAEPGQVLVDRSTRRLADSVIGFADAGARRPLPTGRRP